MIEGSPLLLITLLVRNLLLKRKIRFEREHKGVESHGHRITVIIGTLIFLIIFATGLGFYLFLKKRKENGQPLFVMKNPCKSTNSEQKTGLQARF